MITRLDIDKEFKRRVGEISRQKIADCYQCGRCTAGCPFAGFMDTPPNQVIRLIQIGMRDEVMKTQGPWFCAACLVCQTRCPKGVDIPRVMEAIRVLHLRAKENILDIPQVDHEYLLDLPPLALMSAFGKFSF